MRIWLALRLFFRALFDSTAARRLKDVLEGSAETQAERPAVPASAAPPASKPAAPSPPTRSEAITLLAALQREARLLDLVMEPLTNYSDAEIGAAAREVLRDSGKVLDRFFGIQPAVEQPEGSPIEVPVGYDPQQFRLSGHVEGAGPFRGSVVHHGWKATRCELPAWSGRAETAAVIAPVEVELTT